MVTGGTSGEMEPPLNPAHLISLLHWFSWESDLIWILKNFQLPPAHSLSANFTICLATCTLSLEGGFGRERHSFRSVSHFREESSLLVQGFLIRWLDFIAKMLQVNVSGSRFKEWGETSACKPNQNEFFLNHTVEGEKQPIVRHTSRPCSRSTLDVISQSTWLVLRRTNHSQSVSRAFCLAGPLETLSSSQKPASATPSIELFVLHPIPGWEGVFFSDPANC